MSSRVKLPPGHVARWNPTLYGSVCTAVNVSVQAEERNDVSQEYPPASGPFKTNGNTCPWAWPKTEHASINKRANMQFFLNISTIPFVETSPLTVLAPGVIQQWAYRMGTGTTHELDLCVGIFD